MGQEPRVRRSAFRALNATPALPLLIVLAWTSVAAAQATTAAPSEAAGASQPKYEDRVIEGLATRAAEEPEEGPYNSEGWPRFLRLETRLGTRPFGASNRAGGLNVSAAIETPNHGVLSLDTAYSDGERRGSVVFRQRALPMGDNWLVNNELGVSTPLAPGIMRSPSRIFVPYLLARGASTEWSNDDSRLQLLASAGEPGRLQGFPVSGFRPYAGTVSSVAAQAGLGDWTVALRHARTNGLSRTDEPTLPADSIDSDSTQFSFRRQWADANVQANAISTRSSEFGRTRQGLWLDGEWRTDSTIQGWGAFRLDPDLTWSGQAMASNIEGAYLHSSWRTRQWTADGNVDFLRPVSGDGASGVLLSGAGRWRYDRELNFGAGGSFRRFQGNAGSLFADARWQNEWGTTGLRAELSDGFGQRTNRLTLDHGWTLPAGWLLNLSATAGRESGSESNATLWGGATSFSVPIAAGAFLNANATAEYRSDGTRSTSATASLLWQLATHWSLEGNFVLSEGRQRDIIAIDPLAPLPDRSASTTRTRSLYLLVRYEQQAGSRSVPLGGGPQGGGGRIEGVVFLDANRDGVQQAGETGASGVTVYLDGRYATRTDSQGRFEFPFVAPGARVVTVLNETLPLPWVAGERGETKVEVRVRDTARALIPVTRRSPD